ncbi:MAG: hypothetical protein AAFW87_06020 [Pseudomonadota bacterium]
MINIYSVGFVVAAATVAASVDYYDQSTKAGFSFGQMPVAEYAASITHRFSAAKDEKLAENAERERKSRWRAGGVSYLPEAPEGWTRRTLVDGDTSAIMPYTPASEDDSVGGALLESMEAREAVKENKKRAKRSWIYERGTETIFIEVMTKEAANSNSLVGLVASTIQGMNFADTDYNAGYAVIGGVPFIENFDHDRKRKHHFRVLSGKLGFGHEVHLRVHANASTDSTRDILAAIDYDGLNALLPIPLATVGNDVTLPETMDEKEVAVALSELRTEFLSLRAQEAQFRMSNIDASSMVLNTYAQAYGNSDGMFDLTGGEVVDMTMVIDLGYMTARNALMHGKSADEIAGEVTKLVSQAVAMADAEAAAQAEANSETAPSMSPELAEELGYSGQVKATPQLADQLDVVMDDGNAVAKPGRENSLAESGGTVGEDGAKRIVSKPLPAEKIRKLQENPENTAMQLGLQVAVRKFEGKNGLPQGSCEFSMTNYRVECDAAKAEAAKEQSTGLLSRLGLGGTSASTEQPTAKPKRLELSSDGKSTGKRCVGSFCD